MQHAQRYGEIESLFAAECGAPELQCLSSAQRATLAQYWLDRAEGELTTALAFEFTLEDLHALEAPAAIRELAACAVADEHRHADWCLRWARAIDPSAPALATLSGTRPARFDGASEHDNRVLRTVFGGCFSETIAVHVLRQAQGRITLPSAGRLNRQHLREEVGHARIGWALLGWPGLGARDRQMLRSYVPELTRLSLELWQTTRRQSDPALHALGFLSSELIDAGCEEALAQVIEPGLERLL